MAEEEPIFDKLELSLESSIPGRVEGTGTYFEVKDSEYFNITLESSQEIKVVLESILRMITSNINFSIDFIFTNLTISGSKPNKTYYIPQDSDKDGAVFISDENGKYSWNQNLTQPHHLWFQEEKGTIFLPDQCSFYGNWNEETKTCTLNQDLT